MYNSKKEISMAKFLITGGAGFIGNRFLSLMLEKYPDNEFVVIDSLTYASNYSLIKKYNNLPNKTQIQFLDNWEQKVLKGAA